MTDGLDVIIVDDDRATGEALAEIVNRFYTWGQVFAFTDPDEAAEYCQLRASGIAIFILDVFLGAKTAFMFLDTIAGKYRAACGDTIMVSDEASDDVVNTCVASGVNYLLEKPVRPYALQLAVRAIVAKYLDFANQILKDPAFLEEYSRLLK